MHQLPLFRRFALALAACALLAACTEPAPEAGKGIEKAQEGEAAKMAAPQNAHGPGRAADIAALASADPLPCAVPGFFPVAADTVTVTADSQQITVPGGHALVFYMGAVPIGTKFVVTQPDSTLASLSVEPVGPVTYSNFVGLTINYNTCIPASDTRKFLMFRDDDGDLRWVGNANRGRKVSATLEHFSVYIVGGN